ncbi:MAG: TatD family hydrolase [Candidatus Ornithospirochaeta sp.]
MIFDSHFHLPSMVSRGLSPSLPSSFLGLECATEPGDGEERIRLRGRRRDIFISMGAGPWSIDRPDWSGAEDAVGRVEEDAMKYGADAIGECGFDNYWGYGTKKDQMELFLRQLDLASRLDVPLIIHSRDADQELTSVLHLLGEKTIMHCFSSSPDMARKLLDRGCFLSFSGNVTYKANEEIRKSAILCPKDRILFETDSPYLSPVPMRGKPCRPEYTEYTCAFLSRIRNESPEETKESAVSNFISVFKHSESVVDYNSAFPEESGEDSPPVISD